MNTSPGHVPSGMASVALPVTARAGPGGPAQIPEPEPGRTGWTCPDPGTGAGLGRGRGEAAGGSAEAEKDLRKSRTVHDAATKNE
jgi:hypothetical protein